MGLEPESLGFRFGNNGGCQSTTLSLTNYLRLSGLLFLDATTLIAIAGSIIVRLRVSLERLSADEVAVLMFAGVGVLR